MTTKERKKIELPIHTLGVGLRNQDISKVIAFCKEADNVFMKLLQTVDHIISVASLPSASPPMAAVQTLYYNDDTLEMYKSGLNLILSTSKDHVQRCQHISFIQQVLQHVQDHLNKGVKQVMTNLQKVQVSNLSNRNIEKQSDFLLTLITDNMLEIRDQNQHVKKILQLQQQRQFQQQKQAAQSGGRERRGSGSSVLSFLDGAIGGSSSGSGAAGNSLTYFEGPLSEAQKQMVLTWDSLDERAVIVEGILAGEIQFLQKYLTQRYGQESSEWMHVINTGLDETLIFLQEKEMTYASKMLQNMGFDVRTKLRQICLYTTEKSVRDYLAYELQSLNALTGEEVEMVKFLHQMEELYSCQSFKMAKLLRTETIAGEVFTDPLHIQNTLPPPKYDKLAEEMCGDIVEMDIQNAETSHYSHTLLEWVRTWDKETRQRIIIDQVLYRKDFKSEMVKDIAAVVIWNYLCTRQNIQKLREWLDTQYPLQNKEVLVEPVWPYYLTINREMIDNMEGATDITSEELLNEFARRGIFNSKEQESFDTLLARLRQIQAIMAKPHIIEKSDDPMILGMQDFHRHMIQFCIKKQMPELLYFYLDYWSLCIMSTNLDQFHLEDQSPAWIEMLLHFRIASRSHFDSETVFLASLSTSKCIQNLNESSISKMIEEGFIYTALGTLMYSEEKLAQFLTDPPDKAKQALMSLPTLYHALFDKDALSQHFTVSTVYQLLQGNIPFDPNKLFGWQSTNECDSEDVMQEMPHFSHEVLARNYGHTESLKYTYFLRQGRPCFAFSNFILEEINTSDSGHIAMKRVEKACLKVHSLGIRHFLKPQITAACAAFMEMLGQDSTTFRVHIQTANEIFTQQIAGVPGSLEEKKQHEQVARERIASNLLNCLRQKKKYIQDTLGELEAAIQWYIAKKHISRTSNVAEHKWLLALSFCKCHNIPFSLGYLEDCAKEDAWLRFLTHAQAYLYPAHQAQHVVSFFKNSILREHMKFIINNMCKVEEKKSKHDVETAVYKKDFRARLYARVGVSKDTKDDTSSTDEEDADVSNIEYQKPSKQPADTNITDQLNVDVQSENLFDLLLACQYTPYPAKILCHYGLQNINSVLPVLAACFEDSNILDCLCVWLYSSLSNTTKLEYRNPLTSNSSTSTTTIPGPESSQQPHTINTLSGKVMWSLSDLHELVHKGLCQSQMMLVYDGFYIFFPQTVILPFLRCVAKFYQQEHLSDLKKEVDRFKHMLEKLKSDKESIDCKVFPVTWLEELVLSVIKYMMCHLTNDPVGKFLQLLDETNISKTFSRLDNVPDISLLHRLHLQTKNTDVHINFTQLMETSSTNYTSSSVQTSGSENFQVECGRIITDLQSSGNWNEARVVAELIGLPAMDITMNQLNTNIENLKTSGVWEHNEVQDEFWNKAEILLSRYEVDPITGAKFFQEHADQSCRSSTKEYLYLLAYNWLSKASSENKHSLELFTHIWKAKITKVLERDQFPVSSTPSFKQPSKKPAFDKNQLRKLEAATVSTKGSSTEVLTQEQKSALEVLLDELLDQGKLHEVMKVANHFKHPCQDLNIIVTCNKLAKGEIAPEALDTETKKLLTNPKGTSRVRKTSLQMVALPRLGSRLSIASQMSELGDVFMEEDNILSCIQLLSQQCTHGKHCCDFMLLMYQIAKMLEIEYKETLAVDEFSLLGHVIKSDLHTKYMLAKSFIQASYIPDAQIAGYLCNVVVEALKFQLGLTQGSEGSSPLRPTTTVNRPIPPGGFTISDIVQLCDNPALLGQRLLTYVVSMNSSEIESNIATLSLEVELLIYAHDCFTISCHMEGISDLLRACRTVVQMLNSAEEYPLMVRLLTSVGRYSEMVYIFDILKQQHQFELLFRKGTDKESKLKLAILDYLQRYHPDDTDTYTMVALHFTMYREIAHMLQKAAKKLLNGIQGKTIENSPEIQAKLKKALHYLSDAAESYVKENCLRHAEECVKKAKLVALQIQFLPSKIRVINLDIEGLRSFARSHKKVHEVRLVLEVYNQNDLWSDALYTQLIINGDIRYFNDVTLYVKLTKSLVTDIAEKFRSDVHQTKHSVANMRKLLMQCPDTKSALILAKRLDMKETVTDLRKGPSGAYLKDCTMNKTV